jgi:hypothetical protein
MVHVDLIHTTGGLMQYSQTAKEYAKVLGLIPTFCQRRRSLNMGNRQQRGTLQSPSFAWANFHIFTIEHWFGVLK